MAVDLDCSATMLRDDPEMLDVELILVDLTLFWVGGMNRISFELFTLATDKLGHVQRR